MGPHKRLLASIVTMLFFPFMLHRANSEEEFFADSADGPAAESPGEPWLSPGTQPWVADVDDYGAGAAGDDDDTEVKVKQVINLSVLRFLSCQAACSEPLMALRATGVSWGVERGLQLL